MDISHYAVIYPQTSYKPGDIVWSGGCWTPRLQIPYPHNKIILRPNKPAPEPPKGYRFLLRGETVQEGDKVRDEMDKDGWILCDGSIDLKLDSDEYDYQYIRLSPEPPKGYRFLQVGEVIQEGDKFNVAGEWEDCYSLIGSRVGDNYTDPDYPDRGFLVIRSIEPDDDGLDYDQVHIEPSTVPTQESSPPDRLVPEGYRLLADDEVIQDGDIYRSRKGIKPAYCDVTRGCSVIEAQDKFNHIERSFRFFRPLKTNPTVEPSMEDEPDEVVEKDPTKPFNLDKLLMDLRRELSDLAQAFKDAFTFKSLPQEESPVEVEESEPKKRDYSKLEAKLVSALSKEEMDDFIGYVIGKVVAKDLEQAELERLEETSIETVERWLDVYDVFNRKFTYSEQAFEMLKIFVEKKG